MSRHLKTYLTTDTCTWDIHKRHQIYNYRISSYSFRGNYSFLNLEIQRSQYIRPKVTVHKGAETIQGRKLFKGGNYMRKYGIYWLDGIILSKFWKEFWQKSNNSVFHPEFWSEKKGFYSPSRIQTREKTDPFAILYLLSSMQKIWQSWRTKTT